MDDTSERNRRQRAEDRVEEKLGFYVHVAVYLAVMLGLLVINLSSSTETLWFKWPLFGWGIAVALHALAVFVFPRLAGMRGRMVERELEREAR